MSEGLVHIAGGQVAGVEAKFASRDGRSVAGMAGGSHGMVGATSLMPGHYPSVGVTMGISEK